MGKASDISRRRFLATVAAGLEAPLLLSGCTAHAQNLRQSQGLLGVSSSKTLLQPSDFTFLGYHDVQTNGERSNLAQGLTHRYVEGDLRLLSVHPNGRLDEISLTFEPEGGLITTPTRTWRDIGGFDVASDYKGLWWDEAKQRLWTVAAVSYTADFVPTQIYTRSLNDNGTISNLHGPASLEGITAKRVFGGVQPVPEWFQQQFGIQPYVVGWGGGTSLILQGGNASIGPTMYAIPDPAGLAKGATIRSNSFRTIMDYAPAADYHGVRLTIPTNYLDGGDSRPNPSTPPTAPPLKSANWLSPRKDGKGWWTDCDAYWNTGQWIDTPKKHGFIAVLSAFGGKVYYMSSDVYCDRMQFELHIFDPLTLGAAARNRIRPYDVEPTFMRELDLPGMGQHPRGQMTPGMAIGGATYDPISKRLFLLGLGIGLFEPINRIFVFQVDA